MICKTDLHCHSLATGHAYHSAWQVLEQAKIMGLEAVAITDHGPAVSDACPPEFFEMLAEHPRDYTKGITVLSGVEANIVDYETGALDLEQSILDRLDWVIASYHDCCIEPKTKTDHTLGYLKALENPAVDVLGHIGRSECFGFTIDKEAVVKRAKELGKLIELNEHSFRAAPDSGAVCKKIAELCIRYEQPVVLNTDAHYAQRTGIFTNVERMLSEIHFPSELILNKNLDGVRAYLKQRKNITI